MKRRQALQRLGMGISTSFAGASWLMSCKKDDPGPQVQYDGHVVIIGAGAAGLYAADILVSKGINVTVLEASNQLGGRIHSLRNQEDLPYQSIADFPVELGAEYFQGMDSVWGKIVGNLNLQTVDMTPAEDRFIIDGVARDSAGWGADPDFNAAQNFFSNIRNFAGANVSVRDAAAAVGVRGQNLVNSQVGNFYGSSSDRVGMKGLADQLKLVDHDQKFYTLRSNPMQDVVISRFADVVSRVQFNAQVKFINHGSDPIEITLADGTELTANKVVVTVPVTILKSGITFTPGLPASKTSALEKIGMDASVRVVLDFKKNFWGEYSRFIWGGTTAPQYFNGGVGRSESERTLSITVNGPKALELSNLGSDQMIVDAILAEIDTLYEGQGSLFIRRKIPVPPDNDEGMIFFVKDWTKEPFIKGGYSFPLLTTSIADREALSAPVNKKLFFAGEATDLSGETGTINGALSSAERASEELVQSILEVS